MIPNTGSPSALAIDICSFQKNGSLAWKELEEIYAVVYMERYQTEGSILLWRADDRRSVSLSCEDVSGSAEQIVKAAAQLAGTDPDDLCVVSADHTFCQALRPLFCMTVEAGEELTFRDAHRLCDYYAKDAEVLVESLKKHGCLFPAEAAALGKTPVCPPAMTRLYSYGHQFPLYFCGRYNQHKEADTYTRMLRDLASKRKLQMPLAKMLELVVRWVCKEQRIDAILSVPPKPGDASRFSEVISHLSESLNVTNLEDAVFCKRQYPALWHLSKAERSEAVHDAFAARRGYDFGGRVLILDDVVTSGVTMEEMAQTLLSAGAKDLVFLALGITQDPF